jgi:beta-barrel assembly-enhancing protease
MRAIGWLTCGMLLIWAGWCGAGAAADDPPTASLEKRLWSMALEAQKEQERTATLLHAPGLEAFLQQLAARLWAQAETDLPPVSLRVVQEAVPDAQAYPNGVIYLTTGMLAHARNQDQLAMIVAHEIIHYTRRHALAAFSRLQAASAANGDTFDQRFSSNFFAAEREFAVLCEAFEEQADREGLALMQAAGYCAGEVVPLLLAFQAAQAQAPGNDPARSVQADILKKRYEHLKTLVDRTPGAGACRESPAARQAYLKEIAPALLANARSALQQGRWAAAAGSIDHYLSVRPDDARAHYMLGEIQSRGSRGTDQALAAYRQAIRLDRSFAPAYRAIGLIHFKEGRLRQARRYFETSLALAPQAQENEYIRGYMQLCRE